MRRTGLIGFGSIAENGHVPALLSFPEVDLVAVADVSPQRLDRAHTLLPNAALYASPLELIEHSDIDTLDICSPPHTHGDSMVAACRRGIANIVCEKPFVLSTEEYLLVAHAREESGSRVVSVNNWMHSDLNQRVTEVLSEGVIGAVRSVELRTGRPDVALGNAGWMPRWRTDPAVAGGGIILDHGWHQLYLVMSWMREPLEAVAAEIRTVDARHGSVEDEATITMSFHSGRSRIELAWTASGRSNEGHIEGTEGSIAIHDDNIVVKRGADERTVPFSDRLTQSSYHPDWFQKMLACSILDRDDSEANRNFAEAGVLVGAVSAAYRSARQGGVPCPPESAIFTPKGANIHRVLVENLPA